MPRPTFNATQALGIAMGAIDAVFVLPAAPLGPEDYPLSLSKRVRAIPFRRQIEGTIAHTNQPIEIDFEGCQATQSFIDELVGVLVLERGPSILDRVSFKRCTPELKAIIQFVVSDRAAQHAERIFGRESG